jgi:hypothetical protein
MPPTLTSLTSHSRRTLTAIEYYRHPAVRTRIREYCGATGATGAAAAGAGAFTCAYVAAVEGGEPSASWESARLYPPSELPRLLDAGADISRSMWDTESLLFHLDLDYLNPDHPAEAFLHPADVFFALEPVYAAAHQVLHTFGIDALEIVTGRGHHFSGRIPWTHPVVHHLAELVPETPAWHGTMAARLPEWMPHRLDESQARAYTGLGMLVEHLAHLILRRAAPLAPIPVVFNGTEVGGTGLAGRACVSIDFSYAGDPLDVRHMRVAFGAYQLHRFRPDIFGTPVAHDVPVIAAVPRAHRSLYKLLKARRPAAAALDAEHQTVAMPDVAQGIASLLVDYLPTRLASFHRDFYRVKPHPPAAWPDTYHRFDASTLAPCIAEPLLHPNDLLLQPARLQYLTRGLLAAGWDPRHIASLVYSRYAGDHGWGTRWARQDVRTRAEFDVRVFAGLIAAGADQATDFNCVSAQEKHLCPHDPTCHRDLRLERVKLLERVEPA